MSNKFLFLTLFVGSFLISNLFRFGIVDQDYYSFYYVGQGVSEGMRMYAEFADNKGPILYLVFALLNILFGKNLILALIIGSTVIDALTLFTIFKIIQRDWGFKWFKNKTLNILLIAFCLLLFKSFSIGTIIGGLYSENVGIFFLTLSLWTLTKNHSFLSGVLFSLSYLSRITYVIFLPFFILELYLKHKSLKLVFRFIIGQAVACVIISLYLVLNQDFSYFIYNVVELNLNYVNTSRGIQLHTIAASLSNHPTIFITLFLTITLFIFKMVLKYKPKELLRYASIVIFSGLATFAGGLFYFHHFIQFGLAAVLTISLITQKDLIKTRVAFAPILALLTCLLFFNFIFFLNSRYSLANTSNKNKHVMIPTKKHVVVVPYYPIYYFILEREAPDRYFQSFFLMKNFNSNNQIDISAHKKLSKQKLENTTFLFVNRTKYDKLITNGYKEAFSTHFRLKKVNEYRDLDATIEVYESSK